MRFIKVLDLMIIRRLFYVVVISNWKGIYVCGEKKGYVSVIC